MSNPATNEERYLLDKIRALRKSYEAAIKPYVDRLVELRALSVSPHTLIEFRDGRINSYVVPEGAEPVKRTEHLDGY